MGNYLSGFYSRDGEQVTVRNIMLRQCFKIFLATVMYSLTLY